MKRIESIIVGCIGCVMMCACESVLIVPIAGPLTDVPNLGEIKLEPTASQNNISRFSYKIKDYDKCTGSWSSNSPTIDCADGHRAYIRVFNNDQTAIGLIADTRGNIFRINARPGVFAPSIAGMCMDASIAYASCMASCEEEEPPVNCELPERCGVNAAAEIACVMEQLEELRINLIDFINHVPPPLPIPVTQIRPDS